MLHHTLSRGAYPVMCTDKEKAASSFNAPGAVCSVDKEKVRLEKDAEWLVDQEMTDEVD